MLKIQQDAAFVNSQFFGLAGTLRWPHIRHPLHEEPKVNRLLVWVAALVLGVPAAVLSQPGFDPAAAMAAQRDAMRALAALDGVWRGPGSSVMPGGETHTLTQTERIGSFLEGTVKVIEGRGYTAAGAVGFNALGIISYDPVKKAYNLRTYAQGRSGDFVLTPTAEGYVWEVPAGPMTLRYTVVIKDGAWREIGERITPGNQAVQFFEMNLKRIGDSSWPAAGAIPGK